MPARWAADGPKTSTLANNLELVLFRLTKSPGQLADHLVLRRGNYITCVSGGLSDHTQFCCALSWKQNTCYDLKDIRYWTTRPYLLVSSHLKETHFFTLCYHFVKKTKKKNPRKWRLLRRLCKNCTFDLRWNASADTYSLMTNLKRSIWSDSDCFCGQQWKMDFRHVEYMEGNIWAWEVLSAFFFYQLSIKESILN